jgi:ATP-dependent Lon protease
MSDMRLRPEARVELKGVPAPRELTAEEIRFHVVLDGGFKTTEELFKEEDFSGQERALAALEIGLGVAGGGFNIFVSGLAGSENLKCLSRWIGGRVGSSPTPGDWVYVHNFQYPDSPRAIYLGPGQGPRLKQMMRSLVRTLREELPKAFRQAAFDREKGLLREKYNRRAQELSAELDKLGREKGFLIRPAAGGNLVFVPLVQGKPLQSPEEFSQLSEGDQRDIEKKEQELMEDMAELGAKHREVMREMADDIRQVERRFCEKLLDPLIAQIEREIRNEKVNAYLAGVREHTLNNLDDFKEVDAQPPSFPFLPQARERDPFLEYEVNVVVDNAGTRGAPVVVEGSPTYLNLFGTIERVVDRFGRLVTNFTRIKSGSLLRAHGGYLIFSLEDALTEPAVWKVLKRTLRSGRIEMETYEPFALFSASGLKPEPVEINAKVIVVGSPFLYHLLYRWDEEFREIFKVRADFRHVMELEQNHLLVYAQWVAKLCQEEGLPHFDRSGIERLIEFGARQAEDREKILASYTEVAGLIREAAYWARKGTVSSSPAFTWSRPCKAGLSAQTASKRTSGN